MKLTPWYPAGTKPVRDGVYLRRIVGKDFRYSKWTGKYWVWSFFTIDEASKERRRSALDHCEWRGLAEPPK